MARTEHAHVGRARSPSRPRPRAFALTASTTTRRSSRCSRSIVGSAFEYDCSYQMPLLGGLRPFRKHHEIVELLTCYGDHFDVMTGATGISWRREDRVQARARRSSTFSGR